MYLVVLAFVLIIFVLAICTLIITSLYDTDQPEETSGLNPNVFECAKKKAKRSPVKSCPKKVRFVEPEPEPEPKPEPEPEPEPEPVKETEACPNLDDYVHRSELKPNVSIRSNPYYFEKKCKTCKKSKNRNYQSIYHHDGYEYDNVKMDEWIPVEENNNCKL